VDGRSLGQARGCGGMAPEEPPQGSGPEHPREGGVPGQHWGPGERGLLHPQPGGCLTGGPMGGSARVQRAGRGRGEQGGCETRPGPGPGARAGGQGQGEEGTMTCTTLMVAEGTKGGPTSRRHLSSRGCPLRRPPQTTPRHGRQGATILN